jgi:hypothetical protein
MMGVTACGWPFGDGAADAGMSLISVRRAECGQQIGGRSLSSDAVESIPGYSNDLATLDLTSLPAEIDISQMDINNRARLAYALEMSLDELGETLQRDTLLKGNEMAIAVLASFAPRDGGSVGFDLDFFRRGFHAYYACTQQLPLTLTGFETLYGRITDYPRKEVAFSIPKGGPRWVRENVQDHIYVAETVGADGGVREYEILISERRADGALNFLVYDSDGDLMDRSEFATVSGGTVVSASPFACMSCHVDFTERTYDVILPIDL